MQTIRRIAVMTSGGDAPGMNAAIRAVVRAAADRGIATVGVRGGYAGLMGARFDALDDRAVGGILQRGGTILGSARCPDFREAETQRRALDRLTAAAVDGIVVIGGNGSQRGTLALHRLGFPAVGVASTIGVDTALNTAIGCIDRLKDTATSHHRAFVVELMGRDAGYLALMSAIATGAELATVPERPVQPEAVAEDVQRQYACGKLHYIIVVAEGSPLSARDLTEYLCQHPCGFEARLSVLGHVQRGGTPTAFDRLLGSRLGAAAVAALAAGRAGVVVGWKGKPAEIPLDAATVPCRKVTIEQLALADILAR